MAERKKLVVAVSSRALFDLEQEHKLFEEEGYRAFRDYQVTHKKDILNPGVAFHFVRRLLAINERFGELSPFDVVAFSRNSPETAQRFFNSCRAHNLRLSSGCFTSGHSTFPYLKAFDVSLFLSANLENVNKAINDGVPAGLVLPSDKSSRELAAELDNEENPTLRIAFDFDGVIADDESEREYQKEGIQAFHKFEQQKALTPHAPGPLQPLFESLSNFQRLDYELHGRENPYFSPAIRISVVTARGAPSEERLITTLKSFGMSATELFLLDGRDKTPILQAIRPHIFFDDQQRHLEKSYNSIPSVLVPFGIHNPKSKP